MKKVTVWSAIGSLWTVFYLCLVVIVTIPDFPRTGPLWYNLCLDPNGYFHELWYLTVGYLSGMAALLVVSAWHAAMTFLETVRWVGVLPDGQPVFYRKKKKGV
jgi:hypothetical protein